MADDDLLRQGLLFDAEDDEDPSPTAAAVVDLPFAGPTTVAVAAELARGPGPTVTLELRNHTGRDLELAGSFFYCGAPGAATPPALLAPDHRAAFAAVDRPEEAHYGVSAVWLYRVRSGLGLALFVYHPLSDPVVHGAWLTDHPRADRRLYDLCWTKRRGAGVRALRATSYGFEPRCDSSGTDHAVVVARLSASA